MNIIAKLITKYNIKNASNPYKIGKIPANLYIGLSGGVDSVVLLHLCHDFVRQNPEYNLTAVHINHGLNPNADIWGSFCQQLCATYKIAYISHELNLSNKLQQQAISANSSIENLARSERYKIWRQLLTKDNCLLLAHHANDQAETILYRLLRGTGLTGLAGMRKITAYNHSKIIRPLLKLTKAEILQYAAQHKLEHIEDDSNSDNRFARNFLRNQIVPLLQTRWPKAVDNINRAGKLAGNTNSYVNRNVKLLYPEFIGSRVNTLSVKKLLQTEPVVRREILRLFIKNNKKVAPSFKILQLIKRQILVARIDAGPSIKIKDYYLTRYRDDLYLLLENPLAISKESRTINLIGAASVNCSGIGRRIKKIFQHHGIPPWERGRYAVRVALDTTTGQTKLVAIEGLWDNPKTIIERLEK